PAGQRQTAVFQLILDLVLYRRPFQRLLDPFSYVFLVFVDPQSERHVVEDAGCEGIWLLKDYVDVTLYCDGINPMLIDVFAAIFDVPFEAKAPHKIVHPIEAAQHRAFAATGGFDERSDGVFLDRNLRVTNRLEGVVVKLVNLAIYDHFVLILCDGRWLTGRTVDFGI